MRRLLLITLVLIFLVFLSLYSLQVYLLTQTCPAPKNVRLETVENGVLVSVPSKKGMAHGLMAEAERTLRRSAPPRIRPFRGLD